ncbi:Bug family tripartite tricarboxylate transporter substrate binding protein [Ramlibacter sp.]|uniref:Bug family tripartite tricarboxylate transporter substrate binding protein n=1 Tax=Ramlibacter sp. TaxID=1917967 RepID=UPI003D096C69
MFKRHVLGVLCGIAAAACLAAPLASHAQDFPSKPVKIVIPGAPGSSLDAAGRELQNYLQQAWGVPFVMEYKPGAGSGVGADFVAKSPPDGYTWLIAPYNVLTLNQHLYNNPLHPLKEFTPISTIASVPFVLVVHPSVPANNVSELVAYAKANPGKLNYGTSGAGSAQHLGGELLKAMAGVNLTEVPYKAGAAAIVDLLAGRIQVYIGANNSLLPHLQAGKLRALGTAGARRGSVTANLPTIAESGVPGYALPTWTGVVLPAGVPRAVVDKVHAGVLQALGNKELRDRLAGQGIEVETRSTREFADLIEREYTTLGKLVKDAGIKVN